MEVEIVKPLADGAQHLPMSHLSVRVAWHDTDWTGRVCASPSTNHSCAVLKNVKENKRPLAEEAVARKPWRDFEDPKDLPPCVSERAGFMRSRGFTHPRTHNYAWKKDGPHAHFAPTLQHMPPYSLEVTPFRWVMRKELERYATPWGIAHDDDVEQRIYGLMGEFDDTWVQDKGNQEAMLDSFFSALRPAESLVFLYAKDLPLVEESKPGERYLIGVGFVEGVDATVEWEYSGDGPLRSIMWERGVAHSIRNGFPNGFLLPYHELLANPTLQGEDLDRFVARAPGDHFDEFSYVSELVTHDGAIAALTELARVVELLPDVVDGPWTDVANWLADRLSEAWHARGPYPGLGPMLAAAGLERGPVLARRVLDDLPEGVTDPWPELQQAVAANRDRLVGRLASKAFSKLLADPERYRQLRIMSRFALTGPQARELWEKLSPAEVIDNPYLLYEVGAEDPVAFATIDRGLFPQDADALVALAADPIDDPVEEAHDDRRVRAACIEVLRQAAERGHTLLDESGLRRRLADLELTPRCDPPTDAFEIAVDEFAPLVVERSLAQKAGRGWQLAELAEITEVIRAEVQRRVEGRPLEVTWDWRERIEAVLPDAGSGDDVAEEEARQEKAAALETIVRSRVSALIGPAGSGKTSMLRALCGDDVIRAGGVLLLAPTGKAAVQLRRGTGLPTLNLAQFLGRRQRWDRLSGQYYLAPHAPKDSSAKTVVIDEASMLTEPMLAAAIDGLDGVERLILCGDPRQLPPIGAGRPFVDLVSFLGEQEGPGGGLAELRTGRRQIGEDGGTPDDVALASLFAPGSEVLGAEDALARILAGDGDGRVEIIAWDDEPDLHRKLVETLEHEEALGLEGRTRGAICRSFGADCEDDGLPGFPEGSAGGGAENWQLLSPVRARPGGVVGLNELVRRTWRGTDVRLAAGRNGFAPPMGADQVVFADKVMLLRNDHKRKGERVPGNEKVIVPVANGEIGMIVRGAGKKGHKVELSTQPGLQFIFWKNELNGDSEKFGEWMELAYAITIHKSQGSQFRTVFVVVPDPCALLTPELLYTALTRQVDRVVLFKQGDPSQLRTFADPARSETAGRLTCLFRDADPYLLPDGKTVVDGRHIHRTARGDDLVRSKSEVIVADALHELGLPYRYEAPLQFPGEVARHPDFTIDRPGTTPVYWEHLGRLDLAGYRADWEARKAWYAAHGILPHEDDGGPEGTLVCSDENTATAGIDSHAVRALARVVFG